MADAAPSPPVASVTSAATCAMQSSTSSAPHEPIRGLSSPPVFPGHALPDTDDRNIAALHYLDGIFAYDRIKSDATFCSKLLLLVYFPIGLALLTVRLFVFLPITGIIASLICIPRCLQTYLLRVELFLFFGLWITVKGSPAADARIWVANHISEIDALCLRSIDDPHILGYSFYATLWWLKCSPLNIMRLVYVQQQSRTEGNADARNEINDKIKAIVKEDPKNKILVFPEGGLTNTNRGILQFHKFMFGLGEKVQPIVLSHSTFLPLHLDTGVASFFSNVATFFFTPIQRYTVEFLEPSVINLEAGEDSLEFARRTAFLIADSLKQPSTPFLYSDKRKWLKLKARMRSEGFDFDIIINEKENSLSVKNKLNKKEMKRIDPNAVLPVDGQQSKHEDSSANRSALLKYIYETWDLSNPNTNHLVFRRAVHS